MRHVGLDGFEHGGEQRLLGREVVVNVAFRNTALGCDSIDARCGEAALAEQRARDAQNRGNGHFTAVRLVHHADVSSS